MAGRAGRRGLDKVGTVIITCWSEPPPLVNLKVQTALQEKHEEKEGKEKGGRQRKGKEKGEKGRKGEKRGEKGRKRKHRRASPTLL